MLEIFPYSDISFILIRHSEEHNTGIIFSLISPSECTYTCIHVSTFRPSFTITAAAAITSVVSDSVRPHRRQPTRLPRPWDSPGKNTGVGCHFLLQCMKVRSEREVAQSCPTLCNPVDGSPPGSSVHGIFQARVLEWGAITFSISSIRSDQIKSVAQSCPTLCDPIDGSPPAAPRSLGFSSQEHWSGLPFPSPIHESEK